MRKRAEHRDHVWSYDFVFDRTDDGRPLRMLTMVDEYTRECLTIDVARQYRSEQVLDRLAALFVDRGAPTYLRSDNGSEFTATAVREWLEREWLMRPGPQSGSHATRRIRFAASRNPILWLRS